MGGQVAAGQTAGGEITAIDFGHGTGLQPAKAVNPVVYAHTAYPYYSHHTAYPYTLHHLGKREAEPYTLGQVAAGQTAGGEITAIDFGHGTGLQPAKAATHVVYAHTAYPYYSHPFGGVYYHG